MTAWKEESRSAIIVAFLGAGLVPPSSKAMVTALAEARRGLAGSRPERSAHLAKLLSALDMPRLVGGGS